MYGTLYVGMYMCTSNKFIVDNTHVISKKKENSSCASEV